MKNEIYRCPVNGDVLRERGNAFFGKSGQSYPIIEVDRFRIPLFISDQQLEGGDKHSLSQYKNTNAEHVYRNFLNWLFETFGINEVLFRRELVKKLNLKNGNRVLITGCGLGDDLPMVFEAVGNDGAVYAQDISDQMVIYAAQHISKSKKCINIENIYFNVSNASHLPFADGYFDAAYHFGGINLFSNIALALQEMCRVVRVGGTIVVGDEGVAPWLKDTEYGKIVINNNPLWSKEPPLGLLPQNICNLNLTWVLGNCFYVMDFEVANSLPTINMNVPHKGVRGGTMEKRYFGRLEGVSPSLRDNIAKVALQSGLSQSDWLEHHLGQLIKK